MSLVWKNDPVQVYERIRAAYESRVMSTVGLVLDELSEEMTDWMKTYAPWTNRTFLARLTLFARWAIEGYVMSLMFGYQVPYGIFLETMSYGEFAIVGPAIDKFSLVLIRRLQEAGFKFRRGVTTANRQYRWKGLQPGTTRHGKTSPAWPGLNHPAPE